MKVVGMMTVRDEDDILPESLEAWARALDHLYIVDCGSTDETPRVIREATARHAHLEHVATVGPVYAERVRWILYGLFRKRWSGRDWWMIADADEFVQDDYRPILERATRAGADHVFSEHVNHYVTTSQHRALEQELLQHGRLLQPLRDRLRMYRMHSTLIRCVRNCWWLRWRDDDSRPWNLSVPHHERIVYYHYQYRSPPQIAKRVAARSGFADAAKLLAENPHWRRTDPLDAVSRDDDPTLRTWQPGEAHVRDPKLGPPPTQGALKSLAKRARSMALGVLWPQQAASGFGSDAIQRRRAGT